VSAERPLVVRVTKAQTEHATEAGVAPSRFRVWRWAPTLLIVMLGWVMFRAEHVGDALRLYAAMFRFDGLGLGESYAASVTRLQVATLVLAFAVIALRGWRSRQVSAGVAGTPLAPRALLVTGVLPVLFALAVLKLSAQSYSPFLYFQF
jgi:alginate O-acetyltransferase complex protein AlgI